MFCDNINIMKDNYKPKILIFTTAYLPYVGGAEIALNEVIKRLKSDFDFVVVTAKLSTQDRSNEIIDGVEIYRLGYGSEGFLNKALFALFLGPYKAWRLSLKSDFKLIFALQASFGGISAMISKIFFRLPLIVNFQEGNNIRKDIVIMRLMRRLVLYSADHITAISNYLYNQARIAGGNDHNISIIPNGVDIDVFKPVSIEEGLRLRDKYDLPRTAKIIVTASRLVYKNGIDTLIRGFSLLKDKNSRLVICGDGELLGSLKKLSSDLDISDRVLFFTTKQHGELARIVACADVFVRPSRTEGLGNAFLEAMACGTPIVATNVGGIKDFLKDEITGLRVDIDDPQSIASAIERYLGDDKLYLNIRKNGIDLVNNFYTWDKIASRYREIFIDMFSGGKKLSSRAGKKILVLAQKMDKSDDLLGFFPTWVNKLAEKSSHVDVITLSWGDYKCPENVDVYSLGKELGSNKVIRYLRLLWYLVTLSYDKDLIFAHMSPIFAIVSWPFARLSGARLILWYVHRSVTTKLKLAERLVDVILTTTKEGFGLKSEKVRYIGHGIDTEYLKPFYDRKYSKEDPLIIIAVGRLSPIKNYETLLHASKILRDRGFKFSVSIIGSAVMSYDHKYEIMLRQYVADNKLSDIVLFHGKLPFSDIASFYHQSDLALNMTPTGGLDKAVLEPMACGLPVIMSNEAFRPYLADLEGDLVFKYGDAEDLADKIIKIADKDIVGIGKRLRQMVVDKHSVDNVIQHILND